ncbi:hypothetical protein Tco_0109748 [Tanacetum coccineum]
MTTPITTTNNSHMHNDIIVAAEAIRMILSGIGYDIYSIVDACTTAKEMWIAIERLQQAESLNKQDVKTNLFWEFDLDTISYHKLFDILKQYQNEFNDIRAEKIARNANPLALVAATQQYPYDHYQAPKPHKTYTQSSKQTTSTRSHATTRKKGKEIVKPITHPFESAYEEDNDEKQTHRDKQMLKSLVLIAKHFKYIYKPTNNNIRTLSNTRNKNVDTSPRTRNDSKTGQQHSEQPESINDTYVVETVNSNVIPNSLDMCDNEEKVDQNAKEYEDEHVVLANLIANLKLDTDENKKIQKQLKKANAALTHELNQCKYALEESNDI